MSNHPIQDSEQKVLNEVYDAPTKTLMVMPGEYDGTELVRSISKNVATKVVEATGYVYVCIASPGTAQADPYWQCKRIDTSVAGTTVITWADGNTEFDNTATDPSSLSYA